MIYLLAACMVLFGLLTGWLIGAAVNDLRAGVLDPMTFVFVLSGSLLCLGVMMLGVNQLNEAADRMHGRSVRTGEVTRWSEQLLFADCLILLVYALLTQASGTGRTGVAGDREQWMFTAAIALSLIASLQFLARQMRRRSRTARLRDLQERGNLHTGRRFVMTAVSVREKNIIAGHVLGEVHRYDRVYIYRPDGKSVTGMVSRIRSGGRSVRRCRDCDAEMKISCREAVPVYSTVSDVEQFFTASSVNNAEGPQMVGYIDAYAANYRNASFIRILNAAAVRLRYLVPAKKAPDAQSSADLPDTLVESLQVQFPSVMTKNLPDERVLPVFTDWTAFSRYGEMMQEEDAVSMVMNLRECNKIVEQGYAGVVINPFGPQAFFLSKEYLKEILNIEVKKNAETETV